MDAGLLVSSSPWGLDNHVSSLKTVDERRDNGYWILQWVSRFKFWKDWVHFHVQPSLMNCIDNQYFFGLGNFWWDGITLMKLFVFQSFFSHLHLCGLYLRAKDCIAISYYSLLCGIWIRIYAFHFWTDGFFGHLPLCRLHFCGRFHGNIMVHNSLFRGISICISLSDLWRTFLISSYLW